MIDLDQAGRGRTEQTLRGAGEATASWLEYGWVQRHATTPDAARGDWRIVPDAAGHVLIHGYGDRVTAARIVGPRSRGVSVRLGARLWTVGLRLRPGASAVLLRDDAARWVDRGLPLDDVVPPRLRPDLAALGDGADPHRVLDRLTRLVAELVGDRSPDWRAEAFRRAVEIDPVSATPGSVAARIGLAPRTLRAVLRREVGLSPRTALRIRRVQRAAARIRDGAAPSLSRIAHATGFADHAHLTREFGRLVGEAPTDYRRRKRRCAGTFKPADAPHGDPFRES